MTKEEIIFQSKNLNFNGSFFDSKIADSKVCNAMDYRNQPSKVFDFLEKVGYDMAKKVTEYFHKTSDMHCHYENESNCLKSYKSARTRAFKYLKTTCDDYFLPVPDINMTFDDMKAITSESAFVQGFIDKYYHSDFCLVGDTQQAKRLHRKLDKLELKNDLTHLLVDISNGIEDVNSFYFQNKMMHYYKNYETGILPLPVDSSATKLYYKLLMKHYTFIVIEYCFTKYYFVVNEEQKDCFGADFNEIVEEFNLPYYYMAPILGEYIKSVLTTQDVLNTEEKLTVDEVLDENEESTAVTIKKDDTECSGLLLDNQGACYVVKEGETCVLKWVKGKGSFTTIRGMKPSQLGGITYYYPYCKRQFK